MGPRNNIVRFTSLLSAPRTIIERGHIIMMGNDNFCTNIQFRYFLELLLELLRLRTNNHWRLCSFSCFLAVFTEHYRRCPWKSQQVNVKSQRATGTVRRAMPLGPRQLFQCDFPKKISKTEVMVLFGRYFSEILEH